MMSKRERGEVLTAVESLTALLEWLLVLHPLPTRSGRIYELEQTIAHLRQLIGVRPLVRCPGEAHSNPHIDNCMRCAPRWGWIERPFETADEHRAPTSQAMIDKRTEAGRR